MAKQRVDWCCCFSLQTGVLILAWLSIIAGIFGVFCLSCAVYVSTVSVNQPNLTEFQMKNNTFAFFMISSYLLCAFCTVIAAILAIIGIKKKEYQKIKLFMIFIAIDTLVLFVPFIWRVQPEDFPMRVLGLSFGAYFFTCVYSLYAKIKNEKLEKF